jgi:hypothetical protein
MLPGSREEENEERGQPEANAASAFGKRVQGARSLARLIRQRAPERLASVV